MVDSHDQDLSALVELTLVPGIGSLTQARLRSACRTVCEIYSLSHQDLETLAVPAEACEAILARRYRPMAEEIVDWCLREHCRFLVRGQPEFPSLLDEIYDPPLVLYLRGNLEVFAKPCVAIVGTRRPTPYGLQMAEGLASDLGMRGVAVVSGLARGIDAAAHRGSLDAGGWTVAVLGSGIDVIYPREHRRLSQEIEKRGVIISEFPPGTSPAPQNFPVRNRIISGLALGTLVVEASEYSGSLITARLAMEQNREVYGLPGNLTSPQSFGPNFLIKQGAKLVQSWRDIVEEFPPELRHEILKQEEFRRPETPGLELLGEAERVVLANLDSDRATLFDKLLRSTGFEISRLSNLLLDLEMRGYLRQLPGNLYVRSARPPQKN
jgi:DNA processing protein